jgi:inner membrane transporter RhtA
MPARGYGTLASLEPATGCLIGFLFLGETISGGQMLGIAGVVAASIGTALTLKPTSDAPAAPPL